MSRTLRFGAHFDIAEPFWVLVREAVYQRTQQQGINIVPIDADSPYLFALSNNAQISLIEELLVQEIDVLICQGRVLVIGGGVHPIGEDGKSRVAGVSDTLRAYPQISLQRFSSLWTHASPDNGECTLITLDLTRQRVSIDRSQASLDSTVDASTEVAPFSITPGQPLTLRLFIDQSVIEVFINDQPCLTSRVYPTRPDSCGLRLWHTDQAALTALDIWTLKVINE